MKYFVLLLIVVGLTSCYDNEYRLTTTNTTFGERHTTELVYMAPAPDLTTADSLFATGVDEVRVEFKTSIGWSTVYRQTVVRVPLTEGY